jgi:hypothetical protein
MSSVRRLIARAALTACVSLAATAAYAQHEPLAAPPTAPEFLPRMSGRLAAAYLSYDDDRFTWDTHWIGDFDLVSYPRGRATFLADYQALLGSEFRPFDPYQSNYLLEASGSVFVGRTEFIGVLNHISRHLGDRPKRLAVAENSLGPRVMRRFGDDARTLLDVRVDVRKVIQRSYNDYTWYEETELVARHRLNTVTSVYAKGYGELIQVDKTEAGRDDALKGGRLEAGVRLNGTDGAMELFVGAERMIDADPLDRQTRNWGFVGFRLLGR